ncbi:YfhO family protein [Oscillospiraceae bacterium PP1C4]
MLAQPFTQHKGCCRKAFLYAFLTAALIFIPFMIWDKGYFFFYGDFNVQQIPFYKLAHEAVRSGDILWNWYTDLGANFIGSYSFYLLGSPFFWLTLPFPTEFLPHLMAPLLMLKHACAAATGCLYLKRFVKDQNYAVIGGLLYAFSGFAVYNIFFNHFHEAIVFFPLLLVAIEELVVNNRRGLFALAVAINAIVNYWFFIGEVVFVLLYFAIRSLSPDWRMSFKKFFWIAFEAVIGVLLAMFLFLPSALAIMGNPRTGASELLDGWNFWLYWHCQLYPAIVSSAFFPPDLPSRPNLFPDRGAKWASLSAWLPFFGMTGVIAYLKSKRDWLRRILLISFLCALVPGLNSMFVLFNSSYYARWFYMPVLFMALATVIALENHSIDLMYGFRWTAAITAGTAAILAITPTIESADKITFGLTKYPDRFAAIAVISLLGLAALVLIIRRYRGTKSFTRIITWSLCFVCITYSVAFIGMGKTHSDDTNFIREKALQGRYELKLPDDTFARSDIYDGMDNLGMFWHIPNIQTFHSIIPVSIMDFYPKVGVKRDVSSKPETKYYQLRPLLSVRWLFVEEKEPDQDLMPGYELQSTQLGYNVYENQNFIPMGFTYDYYITVRELEQVPEEERAAVLLRAIVLKDEATARNDDIVEHMPAEYYENLTEDDFFTDCKNRQRTAGSSFVIDNSGFTSTIDLARENLVFYSVPYDKGWTATVNGEPAQIEKVSIGFMAVRAPAGTNTIRFSYTPSGLYLGTLISAGALVLLLAYLLLWRRFGKPDPTAPRLSRRSRSFDTLGEDDAPLTEWFELPLPPTDADAPPLSFPDEGFAPKDTDYENDQENDDHI